MSYFLSALMSNFLYLFLKVSYSQSFPPPLSSAEEEACFRKMRAGDALAREKLIKHNLRLVAHIVKKYYGSGVDQDDLISIGTIGLIKAIDSFDSENGTRFATYAAKCLQNEILMYFRSRKKLSLEVSISETIDTDKEGAPLTYSDIISVDDTIADDLDLKLKSQRVRMLVDRVLDPREREIIVLRYGLNGKKAITQRETADLLGISRSYVSRIEKAALDKIGKAL
jgi:RNA polymerase sporulation-specific sigma factor